MANDGVNKSRRRLLTYATAGVGAVGAVFTAVPFIKSWSPSARTRAAGAPVDVAIGKLEPGQMLRVKWRGKAVYVLRRSEEQLETLRKLTKSGELKDPNSEDREQQPEYARNEFRSIKPDLIVMYGICTHLGCAPSYMPEAGSLSPDWVGGYFCPCHGSKFDFAGRVFKGVPAGKNLGIPPHRYVTDTLIRVGEDHEGGKA
ncbi:MAG: ubiquinol-cytochrome c reductase iron-sulfur subunit [Gammaproteobacteria bacterium]|nr:MAG: ubiquinol-cytochrome c reductase iron-sulfur subunit [Gammaproteobacteria bacterium]